ncbi:hypothetical protein SMICM304S_03308 [Streptomyces microflavus]
MNLAFGAVARAQEEGLDVVLLAPAGGASGRVASRVDGLLVIDPEVGDSAVPGLLDAGVPVVTGERYLGPAATPSLPPSPRQRRLAHRLWAVRRRRGRRGGRRAGCS